MAQRKQLELPSLPQVEDPNLYQYLLNMHQIVANLHSQAQVPNAPTNLTVTPIPGGNNVQFTRSNAISYQLYLADVPDRASAKQIDLKSSNQHVDNVGAGGVLRYYWVVGLNQNGLPSSVLGPQSGTTLGLDVPQPTIPTVPAAYAQVYDTTLGRLRPVISSIDTEVAGQPAYPVTPQE